MTSPRSLRIAVLCTVLLVISLTGCGGGEESTNTDSTTAPLSASDEPLAIGSMFSFSEAGYGFAPQQLKGAELAIEQVNADGGIDGRPLTLIQRGDPEDRPGETRRLARQLIRNDGVLAILGPTFSNLAPAAHSVANEWQVPALAVSNTGPGIVGECDYPCEYIFRNSLGEAAAIPASVASLGGESVSTAAVVHPDDDAFGASAAEIAAGALGEADIEVLDRIVVEGGRGSWAGQLEAALAKRPDILFVTASSAASASDLIATAREEGFEGRILGGNAFNSLAAAGSGEHVAGARSAAAWFDGNPSAENSEFVEAYQRAYDEAPDQFAAQAYTGVLLLAEAMRTADTDFDDLAAAHEAITLALESVQIDTPLGRFSFTDEHDVVQPIWIVEMNGSGGYELVEEVAPN